MTKVHPTLHGKLQATTAIWKSQLHKKCFLLLHLQSSNKPMKMRKSTTKSNLFVSHNLLQPICTKFIFSRVDFLALIFLGFSMWIDTFLSWDWQKTFNLIALFLLFCIELFFLLCKCLLVNTRWTVVSNSPSWKDVRVEMDPGLRKLDLVKARCWKLAGFCKAFVV